MKCATITPNAQRVEEYKLRGMYKSPNGTIRAILDGTVFRKPILVKNIRPLVKAWKKPITIARHAYGDVYKDVELRVSKPGKVELVYTAEDGRVERKDVHQFSGAGIVLGMHNLDKSIASFARACFTYALDQKQDLWFRRKTPSRKPMIILLRIFFRNLRAGIPEKFQAAGIKYFYTLIDDAVARIMRSEGGMVWACKNYDGDVMSDMVASAFGSLAMMASVLVSPAGQYLFEAAHGTVQRHYYKYLQGRNFHQFDGDHFCLERLLGQTREIDNLPQLVSFARALERAAIQTVEEGYVTKDLAAIAEGSVQEVVNTTRFLEEVRRRLEKNLGA